MTEKYNTWEEYKVRHERMIKEECAKSIRFRWWYRRMKVLWAIERWFIRMGYFRMLNKLGYYNVKDKLGIDW